MDVARPQSLTFNGRQVRDVRMKLGHETSSPAVVSPSETCELNDGTPKVVPLTVAMRTKYDIQTMAVESVSSSNDTTCGVQSMTTSSVTTVATARTEQLRTDSTGEVVANCSTCETTIDRNTSAAKCSVSVNDVKETSDTQRSQFFFGDSVDFQSESDSVNLKQTATRFVPFGKFAV